MKTHFKKLLFAGIFATFFSCDTEENLPLIDEQTQTIESNSIDPRFISYLQKIGFKDIPLSEIHESENGYVVEGDISFSKAELIKIYDEMEKLQGKNLQWRYNTMVTTPANQITTFKYKFDSSIPSSIRTSVNQAFAHWNSIRNYKLKFQEVSSGSYNTLITNNPDYPGAYAEARLPISTSGSSGTVGNIMRIDINLFNGILPAQQVYIIAHEIGHLVGLRHSDSSASSQHILIPGTYTIDPNSIMNSGSFPVPSWTNFHYLDLLAIRYYYSYDTSEKPFYAYVSTNSGWGNWTTNWTTYEYGDSQYTYWGVNGYIYTSPKSGTVPIYKYTHVTGTPYKSIDPNIDVNYPSFTKNGILGHVYTSNGPSRTPVYEWYNPNVGYFFTTNAVDGYVQGPGWTTGGTAFYVMSLGTL